VNEDIIKRNLTILNHERANFMSRSVSPQLRRVLLILQAGLLLVSLFAYFPAQPAQAATWLVTKSADTNDTACDADCSLREAIKFAAEGDTIRFATNLIGATITLSGGELVIDKNLTIIGLGPTRLTISGNNQSRIFSITSGRIVSISGLLIRDGFVSVAPNGLGGGGVLSQGNLTLNNVQITNNRVVDDGGGALGGGLLNQNGITTISNSTINGNKVEDDNRGGCFGGGIASSGDLSLYNVTVSGNQAVENGNYCFGGGIDHTDGDLILEFVTIADNAAIENSPDGQVLGGGLSVAFGNLTSRNTIIARNTPENCDLYVNPLSGGHNFEDKDSCKLSTATDTQNTNPGLGQLANNGGSTPTIALQQGSPAIDHIPVGQNNCQAGITTDQRGAVRAGGENRGGSACDSGAYEYASNQQPTALTIGEASVTTAGAPTWGWFLLLGIAALLFSVVYIYIRQTKLQ
jgi:CSLREA domain-containing protein